MTPIRDQEIDPVNQQNDRPGLSAHRRNTALRSHLFLVPPNARRNVSTKVDMLRLVYVDADGSEETVFERVLPKDNAA